MGMGKMIGSKQIRAARALLDISQKEAAEGAGLGLNTLVNAEKGENTPTTETARKIQDFYEGCGIEFIEPDGVRMQPGDREYRGVRGMQQFFNDVFQETRHGTDICIFNGVPHLLIKWAGAEFYAKHAARMANLKDRGTVRVIVEEGEKNLIGSSFAEYRTIDSSLFHERTFYVYGAKVAFFSFGDDLLIKVMNGDDLADSMRVLFNFAWEAAK